MTDVEETLTPQQAANLLGLNVRTVRQWIKEGRFKVRRASNNRCLLSRDSVVTQMKSLPVSNNKLPALTLKRFVNGFEVPANFDLIVTYEELAQYSRAFANRDINFLLLVGSPGSGKSRQMKSELADIRHVWIDNHVTNLGLYCNVFEASNAPLVMDDINHLLKNKLACSLTKALTQTEPVRCVSWESTTKVLEEKGIPKQFSTSSPICLIANQWDGTDPDMSAIQDRSMPVAFYPSAETIHEQVMKQGWCETEVAEFIGEHLNEINQPSMREYFQGMTYRRAGMDWRTKLQKLWGFE